MVAKWQVHVWFKNYDLGNHIYPTTDGYPLTWYDPESLFTTVINGIWATERGIFLIQNMENGELMLSFLL